MIRSLRNLLRKPGAFASCYVHTPIGSTSSEYQPANIFLLNQHGSFQLQVGLVTWYPSIFFPSFILPSSSFYLSLHLLPYIHPSIFSLPFILPSSSFNLLFPILPFIHPSLFFLSVILPSYPFLLFLLHISSIYPYIFSLQFFHPSSPFN